MQDVETLRARIRNLEEQLRRLKAQLEAPPGTRFGSRQMLSSLSDQFDDIQDEIDDIRDRIMDDDDDPDVA